MERCLALTQSCYNYTIMTLTPHIDALKTWTIEGIDDAICYLVFNPMPELPEPFMSDPAFKRLFGNRKGHYCGYVKFAAPILKSTDAKGLLAYIPVHKGITFVEVEEDGGIVYGFDGLHAHDGENPDLSSEEWWETECIKMAKSIKVAAGFEQAYEDAVTMEERAAVIALFHASMREYGIVFDLPGNFQATINVLFGEL